MSDVRASQSELRVIPISDSVYDPPKTQILVPVIEPHHMAIQE